MFEKTQNSLTPVRRASLALLPYYYKIVISYKISRIFILLVFIFFLLRRRRRRRLFPLSLSSSLLSSLRIYPELKIIFASLAAAAAFAPTTTTLKLK